MTTPLTTIQSWSREQLESAFTQREIQLGQAQDELTVTKEELARAEDKRDEFWLDTIAVQWVRLTDTPWETRDGETQDEGVTANITALFQVIETTKEELERYRSALEWYAKLENYTHYLCPVMMDLGQSARTALEETK